MTKFKFKPGDRVKRIGGYYSIKTNSGYISKGDIVTIHNYKEGSNGEQCYSFKEELNSHRRNNPNWLSVEKNFEFVGPTDVKSKFNKAPTISKRDMSELINNVRNELGKSNEQHIKEWLKTLKKKCE